MLQQFTKILCFFLLLAPMMACASQSTRLNSQAENPVIITNADFRQDTILLESLWDVYVPRVAPYPDPAKRKRPNLW